MTLIHYLDHAPVTQLMLGLGLLTLATWAVEIRLRRAGR